jgi:hypothetical protein
MEWIFYRLAVRLASCPALLLLILYSVFDLRIAVAAAAGLKIGRDICISSGPDLILAPKVSGPRGQHGRDRTPRNTSHMVLVVRTARTGPGQASPRLLLTLLPRACGVTAREPLPVIALHICTDDDDGGGGAIGFKPCCRHVPST